MWGSSGRENGRVNISQKTAGICFDVNLNIYRV
jgi:hypothetical protein